METIYDPGTGNGTTMLNLVVSRSTVNRLNRVFSLGLFELADLVYFQPDSGLAPHSFAVAGSRPLFCRLQLTIPGSHISPSSWVAECAEDS